ncbi:hypothetical protein EB061_05830 [bacterium]|nr:hypothetical protein [bacterium]
MPQAQVVAICQPLVIRCCQHTGFKYSEIIAQKVSRDRKLIRARMALAHVIMAAGITRANAAEISGMSYHTANWSHWRARGLYQTDETFRNLCNAIAGNATNPATGSK